MEPEVTYRTKTAQALADDAVMNVQAAEEARDAAVWGCEHPGYIPLSGETVNIPAQPLIQFTLGRDIDGSELNFIDRLAAAIPGVLMTEATGIAADGRQKARIAERKAIADEEAKRPRVVNATTALAPGSVPVNGGGYYSPGVPSPR